MTTRGGLGGLGLGAWSPAQQSCGSRWKESRCPRAPEQLSPPGLPLSDTRGAPGNFRAGAEAVPAPWVFLARSWVPGWDDPLALARLHRLPGAPGSPGLRTGGRGSWGLFLPLGHWGAGRSRCGEATPPAFPSRSFWFVFLLFCCAWPKKALAGFSDSAEAEGKTNPKQTHPNPPRCSTRAVASVSGEAAAARPGLVCSLILELGLGLGEIQPGLTRPSGFPSRETRSGNTSVGWGSLWQWEGPCSVTGGEPRYWC